MNYIITESLYTLISESDDWGKENDELKKMGNELYKNIINSNKKELFNNKVLIKKYYILIASGKKYFLYVQTLIFIQTHPWPCMKAIVLVFILTI